jgi:hypothetical protein
MPSRRRSPKTTSSKRAPIAARSGPAARRRTRQSPSPADATTKRWRRDARPGTVRAAVSAAKAIRWSPVLIEAVLEEMYVDDHFEELLGAPGELRATQYPQAIAIALILRHSWHPDDLACVLKRLGLKVKGTTVT